MNKIVKALLLRFARAFIAGAVGNMVVMLGFTANSWNDVGVWIAALTMSGIVGGISGLIMALDKYFRIEQ